MNHWLRIYFSNLKNTLKKTSSTTTVKTPSNAIVMTIMVVEPFNSVHVGHEHFFNSSIVSCQYSARRRICPCHHAKAKTATMIAKTIIVVLFTIFPVCFASAKLAEREGFEPPLGF